MRKWKRLMKESKWFTNEHDFRVARMIYEYRKLGVRWCSISKSVKLPVKTCKGLNSRYRAFLEEQGKLD